MNNIIAYGSLVGVHISVCIYANEYFIIESAASHGAPGAGILSERSLDSMRKPYCNIVGGCG